MAREPGPYQTVMYGHKLCSVCEWSKPSSRFRRRRGVPGALRRVCSASASTRASRSSGAAPPAASTTAQRAMPSCASGRTAYPRRRTTLYSNRRKAHARSAASLRAQSGGSHLTFIPTSRSARSRRRLLRLRRARRWWLRRGGRAVRDDPAVQRGRLPGRERSDVEQRGDREDHRQVDGHVDDRQGAGGHGGPHDRCRGPHLRGTDREDVYRRGAV
jgi:hypothetical protein